MIVANRITIRKRDDAQVEKLPAKERRQLLQLIDAFLEREKLRGNGKG